MLRRSFIIALAAGALVATTGTAALASDAAPTMKATQAVVELDVIHATKTGEVDGRLSRLAKTLRKAFKGYRGFARLDGQRVTVARDKANKLSLPNGSELEYTFMGVGTDGYLRMSINVGGLSSTVKVRDGGIFFQAGRGYNNGMIVLAFKVTQQR